MAEMNRMSIDASKKKSSDLECVVQFLDGSSATFFIPKRAEALKLLQYAFAYIGLNDESEYFGLRMDDKIKAWVDPTKTITKQCQVGPPYRFYMYVKFFSAEPQKLRDEFTRYLFVLQLRKQLEKGSLQCPDDQVAAELAAFLLQGEFGMFDPQQHTPAFISTFPFYPPDRQNETVELAILHEYKKLRSKEWTPEEADRCFLDRVKLLSNYGVDMHTVKGKDGENYTLGLTPTGVLVYEGENKIGLFVWAMIMKLDLHGKKLKLVVTEENEQARRVMEHTFVFVLPDTRTCKHVWKCAVEHHAFFRLAGVPRPPTRVQQFFRMRSRFYASFRTEHQLTQESNFGSSSFRRRNTSTGQSLRSDSGGTALGRSNTAPGSRPGGGGASFRRVPSRRISVRQQFSAGNNRAQPRGPPRMPVVEDHRAASPLSMPRD